MGQQSQARAARRAKRVETVVQRDQLVAELRGQLEHERQVLGQMHAQASAVIARLRLERDQLEQDGKQLESEVTSLQQQVGDLEEQLAQRVGLGIDVAAARIEELEGELAKRDARLAELEDLVAKALELPGTVSGEAQS